MSETTTTPAATESESGGSKRRAGGLSGMLLPELKQMAGGLGIKGVGALRKSQLIDAIKAAQAGGGSGGGPAGAQSGAPDSGPDQGTATTHQTDTVARVLGGAGLVLGAAALGIALVGRRRRGSA